jgi:hypothetical protein
MGAPDNRECLRNLYIAFLMSSARLTSGEKGDPGGEWWRRAGAEAVGAVFEVDRMRLGELKAWLMALSRLGVDGGLWSAVAAPGGAYRRHPDG